MHWISTNLFLLRFCLDLIKVYIKRFNLVFLKVFQAQMKQNCENLKIVGCYKPKILQILPVKCVKILPSIVMVLSAFYVKNVLARGYIPIYHETLAIEQ